MKKSGINSNNESITRYLIGFLLSVALTLAAFLLVQAHVESGHSFFSNHNLLSYSLISLAIIQMVVQLLFFLHVGKESKPKWNLMALVFAVGVVVILVFGSLWIMKNLDYHHGMTPEQTDKYLLEDEGVQK